jgi:hypothetical protein
MGIKLMAKKTRLVSGVGINDSCYPVAVCAVVCGKKKQIWLCPLYQAWKDMLRRCYNANTQSKNPSYFGCSVTYEWFYFSNFRAWALTQDWKGNQLDKDILFPGNKVYSPGACVFVLPALNKFMGDSFSIRGDWPTGVSWNKSSMKFVSYCGNPFTGKTEHLGLFTSPNAAHESWRARKHELACQYADMQTDPRIAAALRAKYAEAEAL